MTNRLKTRRYSIPDADDATILSIFDKAAHYAADKRTVSVAVGGRAIPSVQTLYALQRRHPEVDWTASRLISCISGTYGAMHISFRRAPDDAPKGTLSELSLVAPEGSHVTDMVRFIASRPAMLAARHDAVASGVPSFEERRTRAARVVRARCLRLRIEAPEARTLRSWIGTWLPAKTYIPMRAVAGRLRHVAPPAGAARPRRRFLERRFVSIVTALVTLLAGVQAVSFLHP